MGNLEEERNNLVHKVEEVQRSAPSPKEVGKLKCDLNNKTQELEKFKKDLSISTTELNSHLSENKVLSEKVTELEAHKEDFTKQKKDFVKEKKHLKKLADQEKATLNKELSTQIKSLKTDIKEKE